MGKKSEERKSVQRRGLRHDRLLYSAVFREEIFVVPVGSGLDVNLLSVLGNGLDANLLSVLGNGLDANLRLVLENGLDGIFLFALGNFLDEVLVMKSLFCPI